MLGRTARKVQRKQRKLRKKNRKNKSMHGPATSATRYTGSVMAPDAKHGEPVLLNLRTIDNITLMPSTNLITQSTVYNGGTFTGLQDFTDMSALYQEFRVLAISVDWVPKYDGGYPSPAQFGGLVGNAGSYILNSSSNTPLFLMPYHGDATAITSTSGAVQHIPSKYCSVNRRLRMSVKMDETDEAQWFSTTSGTVSTMGIKTWFQAATVDQTSSSAIGLGSMVLTALFQFRTRVISATQFSKQKGTDAKEQKITNEIDKKEMPLNSNGGSRVGVPDGSLMGGKGNPGQVKKIYRWVDIVEDDDVTGVTTGGQSTPVDKAGSDKKEPSLLKKST